MASRNIKDCDVRLEIAWNKVLQTWDHPAVPFLTCTHRTHAEQTELYSIGRTKPGKKVTNAKAGQSKHNSLPSLAFDVAFKNPGGSLNWDVKLFRILAEKLRQVEPAIIWGGNFRTLRDNPHYEIQPLTTL